MQRKGATGSRLLLNFDCLIDRLIDWLIDWLRCRFVTSSITFHLISLLYDKQRSSCRRKEGRRTSWWCDTIEMLGAKINVHSETNRLVPLASVIFRGVSYLKEKSVLPRDRKCDGGLRSEPNGRFSSIACAYKHLACSVPRLHVIMSLSENCFQFPTSLIWTFLGTCEANIQGHLQTLWE